MPNILVHIVSAIITIPPLTLKMAVLRIIEVSVTSKPTVVIIIGIFMKALTEFSILGLIASSQNDHYQLECPLAEIARLAIPVSLLLLL